ncbi:hypothetical protein NKR23_g10452 [Pleurostoma richardsiae]|uniref:Uncharacterized protein n=1 Tax=Pleurostoma richardsiae TaxID=41990 RepID=A0AA38RMA2_9PEZI|nr:hypothetical protein NKR23_g10452 [Pleurostoma richardsiae]
MGCRDEGTFESYNTPVCPLTHIPAPFPDRLQLLTCCYIYQPRQSRKSIMSGDRKSDDSLEKELAFEDIVITAGESSRKKREKADQEKKKLEEEMIEEIPEETKDILIQAGENSRTKRGH